MTNIVQSTIFLAIRLLADQEMLEMVGVLASIFLMILLGCVERILRLMTLKTIWIEIWLARQHCKGILIATIYRPPDSS